MAKILVVDDSATNRELLRVLLTRHGHQALVAADGQQALTRVRAERPDIVICDILMPTMDGYEFVRQLRADPAISGTEVIFCSAYFREQQARELALACGVSRMLFKPLAPDQIVSAVDQALAGATEGRAAPIPQEFHREHLRLITDKLSAKADMLQRANQRLSALTELNLQLASERDRHTLLDKVCRGARELIGAGYAVLCVTNGSEPGSVHFAVSGVDADVLSQLAPPQVDHGLLGEVMNERQARRVQIPTGSAETIGLPEGYPAAHAMLAAPIMSLRFVYGWICLIDKPGELQFSDEDERLLSIQAAQVGRIYENGSLYAQVQRHAAQLHLEISGRKQIEAALRESEALFRQLADASPIGIFRIDLNGQCNYCNQQWLEITGRSAGDTIGHDWTDAIHADDRHDALASWLGAAADHTRWIHECRIITKAGDVRWIEARTIPIDSEADRASGAGLAPGYVGTIADITDRRRAEEALFQEKERAQVTLNSIGDAVLVVDQACNVSYLNPVAERMTGWSIAQAIGRPLTDVFEVIDAATRGPARNPAELAMRENATTGLGFHSLLVRRDGVECAIEDSAAPIRDRHGETIGAVLVFHDVSEARALSVQMSHLAQHDFLTNLPNRVLLTDRVRQAISMARRHGHRVALLFLDLDRFKNINDSAGHAIGDELLRAVADRLTACVRDSDAVCRIGGDEFVILLSVIEQAEQAAHVAQKIAAAISLPYLIGENQFHVTSSIGISIFPDDTDTAETMIKAADAAMYYVKAHGRNGYQFFTADMNARAVARLGIESGLHQALEQNQFFLEYQPKFNLQTRAMTGIEALVRWQSPHAGVIAPNQFVSIAEECGLIVPIGRWVLQEVCRQMRAWLDADLAIVPVSVNISALQFRQRDFLKELRAVLHDTHVSPHYLELELTESVLLQGADSTVSALHALKAIGVRLAIDDFGTGYSSLSYLKRFPIDLLKVDRSFVGGLQADPDNVAIVNAVISMGKSLRQRVIAEGVETAEQVKFLVSRGCDEAQGFYFCRPVSAARMTEMFSSQPSAHRADAQPVRQH